MAETKIKHGTARAYSTMGCRCELCKAANTESGRRYRANVAKRRATYVTVDHDRLSDLLHELFPFGLTDDCPARRQRLSETGAA